jgi:PPM family protein phosphatase
MTTSHLRCAGASDLGKVRHNNEDLFLVDSAHGIFAVIDGMGGAAAGEKAAGIALDRLRARLERADGAAETRIREAIAMANNEILRAASENPAWHGMACVLTLAVIEGEEAVIGHVGDSRLYQIRAGEIRKITHDHSPIGEREEAGELTELEAMHHPRRNEVYRDVGSEPRTPFDSGFIEVQRIPFPPDSALLLCSDGLSDLVPSIQIRLAVQRHAGAPAETASELIEMANRAGGKDNITVVVVEGEAFKAPARPARRAASGLAWFAAGLLVAASAAWLSRPLWIPAPVRIEPRELSVGRGAAYASISEALAAARPGDTILVPAGEYREQVHLLTGVSIASRVPGAAILRASASGGPAIVARGVRGARIEGFRVLADADLPLTTGVELDDSDAVLDGIEVNGASTAVEIRGGSPTLRGCTLSGATGPALRISGQAAPWLLHNIFKGNAAAAVEAAAPARPVFIGNHFDDARPQPLLLPEGITLDSLRERNYFPAVRPVRPGRKL